MRHDLIGYLLGALDGSEHDTIRQQLDSDAALRQQLSDLERRLSILEKQRVQFEPPAHLHEVTCRLVADHVAGRRSGALDVVGVTGPDGDVAMPYGGRAAGALSPIEGRNAQSRQWSLVDLVVAAGIFVAAAFLFFPTVADSQQVALKLACQNNQRQVAQSMVQYANMHGALPTPFRREGRMGSMGFVPATLIDQHFIASDQLKYLLCPAAAQAQRSRPVVVTLVSKGPLATSDALNWAKFISFLDSSYCFPLGYEEAGAYVPRRVRASSYLPLLADCPNAHSQGASGADRINVVFEDLRVAEVLSGMVENPKLDFVDNIYRNDNGEFAPGLRPDDAVMLPGTTRPNFHNLRTEDSRVPPRRASLGQSFDILLDAGSK